MKAKYIFALIGAFVLVNLPVNAQDTAVAAPSANTTRVFEVFGGGSYLGIQTREINKDNFGKYGLKDVRGVAIEKVVADSPAQKAGLEDGDVIIRFNGEEVTSYKKLTRLISETAPDHPAKIVVLRNGKERDFTATIGKTPAPAFANGISSTVLGQTMAVSRMPSLVAEGFPKVSAENVFVWNDKDGGKFVFGSTRQIGIGISGLTKQLGDYFGVAEGKGILINNVNDDSPAAKADSKRAT